MDVLWPIPLLLLSHCLALPVSSSFWYWQNYDVLNCDGRWAVTIVPLLWILLFESRSIFKKMRISTCKYFRSWKLSSLTIGVKFDEPERTELSRKVCVKIEDIKLFKVTDFDLLNVPKFPFYSLFLILVMPDVCT